jgi:hypothetical protein
LNLYAHNHRSKWTYRSVILDLYCSRPFLFSEVTEVKEFGEVMKTIMEGKGDLSDIYRAKPTTLVDPTRPRRMLKPSELAKKLFCPAFVQRPYLRESKEKCRQFDVLAQIGRIKAIMRMTRNGYRFVEPEKLSGQFSGRADFLFEDPSGRQMKVEAKSCNSLRPWDIVQCILYHAPGDRISISSLNEFLEPEEWLVDRVKSVAEEFIQFYGEFSEEATRVYLPRQGLCEKCANSKCPNKKPN